jgi:CheY-like chemotaxis protein
MAISEKPDLILCDIMMPQTFKMLDELEEESCNRTYSFSLPQAEKSEIQRVGLWRL